MFKSLSKFDDWLMTPDEDEINQETIAERIKEYMSSGSSCDPFDWENFSLSIYNANTKQSDEILDWAKNKKYEELGRYIYCLVYEAMEKQAENLAIDDYNAGIIGDDRE
jgi:hypothetical protein